MQWRARPGRGRALLVAASLAGAAASALACAAPGPAERLARADRRAREAGLLRTVLPAGAFRLAAWRRLPEPPAERLVVYLEGDAHAWHADGRRVTARPPPVRALALELAARDPAPAVAWLARPCQLVLPPDDAGCEPAVWSHGRFGPEVVSAVDEALTALRREAGARRLELVGYSGGGVLATVVAARRRDVERLVTVAAPLDLGAWLAHHGLGPLPDAVDPAALPPERLAAVEQIHLAGGNDEIVPPAILEGWLGRRPDTTTARLVIVPDFDHDDWPEAWTDRIEALRDTERRPPATD